MQVYFRPARTLTKEHFADAQGKSTKSSRAATTPTRYVVLGTGTTSLVCARQRCAEAARGSGAVLMSVRVLVDDAAGMIARIPRVKWSSRRLRGCRVRR